ncbi:MAG: M12 family metallo-peptidase [Saprospiraceae bacterium]|nr:M12 family metallo-peptidase [Saprospiraceae bacterium]
MARKFLFLLLGVCTAASLAGQSFWTRKAENTMQLRSAESRTIIPNAYTTFHLEIESLKTYLASAPMEKSVAGLTEGIPLDIPMPDGSIERFAVVESPVMMEGLSAKFPGIRSYKAVSKTNKAKWMRFATSVNGFHAAIFALDGEKYIDPYSSESTSDYIVYQVKDHQPDTYKNVPLCGVDESYRPAQGFFMPSNRNAAEVEVRVYKTAVACTGEWGARRGTVEKCLADINVMMNRMNVIYEREMAMRFVLIDENDKLIFLNATTDPYDNSDEGKKLVGLNTGKLNALIPSSSYDIGHVLSVCFDIGGVAQLGSACQSNKGNGVTCNNNNDLSGVVTRVMAHEVGHQLNASHTWNKCDAAADQRAPETAYEPGSGSTIMSYAGSCGTDNVVSDNDDYFHIGSLDQMYAKTRQGGNAYACADKIASGNHFPEIAVPGKSYVIPISTPFELVGTATDEDGDAMTYCWEQYDAGELTTLGSFTATAPLFRSWKPSLTGDVRFLPRKEDIVSGNLASKTEVLPTGSREMNFRFTVRDNSANAGGVIWEDYKINSSSQAGPFKITYPEIDVRFQVGQAVNVTWNVANTDKAPVNCQLVNIYGSFNGALRTDDPNLIPLALNVPNDGSQVVYIPNKISNFFRIVIKAADNIFLTSSRIPSRIEQPTIPGIFFESQQSIVRLCQPDEGNIEFTTAGLAGYNGPVEFTLVSGLPNGATASFSTSTVTAGNNVTLKINTENIDGNQSGQLLVRAIAPGVDTMERFITLLVTGGKLNPLQTLEPANGVSGVVALPKFNWSGKRDALGYEIQVSTSPNFDPTNVVSAKEVTDTTFTSTAILNKAKIYYWRVRAKNSCRAGEWSAIQAFMTEALSCKVYESGIQSVNISASGTSTVELPVQVLDDGIASDVNIKLIRGEHSRLVDLVAYLVAPSGKEALLWTRKCGTQQNLNVGLDDQSPDFFQCPINTGKVYRPESPLSVFNGEAIKGNWKIRVEDKSSGSGGKLQELKIEFCSNVILDQPYLVRNDTLKIHPGNKATINDALLLAQDNNNSAAELVYTIVDVPTGGILTFNGSAVIAGTVFTQAQLNDGRLRYEAASSLEGGDHFTFTVQDGQGGWISITRFAILRSKDFVNSSSDYSLTEEVWVFPNPANQELNVVLEGKASELNTFRITDISGRPFLSGALAAGKNQIDISALPAGMYLLIASDGIRQVAQRLAKL